MSFNKKDGYLDFSNIKMTQLGSSQSLRASFSELNSGLRTLGTNTILKDAYTHFTQVLDANNNPIEVTYYQATKPVIDELVFIADNNSNLAGKYILVQQFLSKKVIAFYIRVNGVGSPPTAGDIQIPVDISENDPASVIKLNFANAIQQFEEFDVEKVGGYTGSSIQITYLQFGETQLLDVTDTGFFVIRRQDGASFKVADVCIKYDDDKNPIWQGNTLFGYTYDVYKAEFLSSRKVELSTGSMNIGTVNAELEVQLSRRDDYPDSGDVHDAVRIGNQDVELDFTDEGLGKGEAKVHDQDSHDKLDTLNNSINSQSDETQTILQTEFDATQVKQDEAKVELQSINTELDGIRLDVNAQFDESQVNELGIRSDIQSLEASNELESASTRSLIQSESDQTQAEIATTRNTLESTLEQIDDNLDSEFLATRNLLQAEFDATQVKQDSIITELQDIEADVTSVNTDLNLQFDETQVKQDEAKVELQGINTELDGIRLDVNAQLDESQTKLDTLNTSINAQSDESQVKLDTVIANQTNKTQYAKITDGVDDLDIKSDGSIDTNIKGITVDGTKRDLPISSKSSGNSTITPLGIGGTFTGSIDNCENFSSILITVKTDQFSAIDGVELKFYSDAAGVNLARELKTTMVPSVEGIFFSVPCEASYFQVVYINGATAQTNFVVETILKTDNVAMSSFPLATAITDTTSAPLVRSVLTGRSTDDTYQNQRAVGVSTPNSTDVPLGASASFTGTFEECLGYSNITVIMNTDQDSATDGFCIEWSTDGINIDDSDCFQATAGGKIFTFGVVAKYFRVVFLNGATAQSMFRLQSILHIARPKPSTHRIGDTISGQNDAELVKSVITGENPNGEFVNKRLTGASNSQSTTALLTANSVFTSPLADCSDYIGVDITIRSDVVSASEGILVQFYDDDAGTILTRESKFTYNEINGGSHFNLPIQGNYFRIQYTNGTTDQGNFVLATRLNDSSKISTIIPISEPILDSLLALLTRSIVMGINPDTGEFENAGVKDGRVQVESVNVPQPLDERFQEYATLSGSRELAVNGTTEQVFTVFADAADDLIVDFLSFQAFASGIKIDKFLGLNQELANGIQVEVKSDNKIFVFRSIRNTIEFSSIFSLGPGRAFELIFASGNDSLVSTFGPASPFTLKKQGTFGAGNDDYIRVKVRDNISTISRLRFLASGRRDL